MIDPRVLIDCCRDERQAKMRAKQLENHFFTHHIKDPEKMSDLGNLAPRLVELAFPQVLKTLKTQVGDAGTTIKKLYRLADGKAVETVLMLYSDRATLCISCQVGCAMGCPFCATGKLGLGRNLTTREMLEEVFEAAKYLDELDVDNMENGRRLTNIVFMGEGEPTQNLPNIFEALKQICAGEPNSKTPTFGLSGRNITISTVGISKGIKAMTQDPRPFRLALSLHTPFDEQRNELVPMNKHTSVAELLDLCLEYFNTKNRRVSIEYALMRGINDTTHHAKTLAKLLNQRGTGWAHVNLIPLNEVEGSKWTASTPEVTRAFIETLTSKSIPTTLRISRGQDIDGACGQLALTEN
ncbi:putative dual-specificity RNA methyltransferase RlmN [Actinomycetota bacterium]|nr:putative dual-specificity RNA methyltransferase RlmN [Actinomycetota bacterium]